MRLKLLAAFVMVAVIPAVGQRFVKTANTLNDLLALNVLDIHTNVLVGGYRSPNDGGGGLMLWYPGNAAATNLGTIFKPNTGNGRWIRQFSGPVNVLWFGARRDRVNGGEPFTGYIGTDSSTNFQNAIDFMLASTNLYGELRVPVGRYTWTNSVYLDGSIQLIGEGTMNSSEGIGGSHILVTSANGTGLIVGTRMVTSQDWVLEGLAFDGYTNNASYGIQIGDATHEASKGLIRKISARKFNGSGIRVVSCNTMLIEKCDLYAQSGTGGAALLFDYVSGGSINAITTIGNHLSGGTDGWRILNGHGIVSMGDVIEGITGAGILMRDTSANPGRITHNTFIGTWMEQNGTNIVAYYPGVSRTMVDNVFDGVQLRSITSTNQVVIGNGTFAFYNTRMGGGENMVMRGMTSAIIHWHQNNTNGTWFVDADASNPTVVNYVTQDGRKTGIGTQNPLWRLHLSNVTDTARIGLDSSNIIGSMVRTGPAISGANASDGISIAAGAGLGASLVPNNGGSWGLTVTSTNISYGTASPNPNAVFDLVSPGNNKAFMPPRMTQAQRDAISLPTAGMVIYQNDGSTGIYFYNGTVWTNSGALPAAFTGAPYIMQANDASFSAERALAGTASQITVTDGGANSTMTLSIPSSLSVATGYRIGGLAASGNFLRGNGTDFIANTIQAGDVPSSVTSGAFIMQANDANFSAERALTGTANQVVLTDGGANSTMTLSLPQSIHTAATPTFSDLTLSALTNTRIVSTGTGGTVDDNATLGATLTTGASLVTLTADTSQQVGIGGVSNGGAVAVLDVLVNSASKDTLFLHTSSGVTQISDLFRQRRVATTDATVTTIQTIAITAGNTYLLDANVRARRTAGAAGTADDGAVYIRRAMVTTKAGTVTINAVQDGLMQEDQAAWDCTFTVSGTDVLLRVTGAVNNNIEWHSLVQVSYVSGL